MKQSTNGRHGRYLDTKGSRRETTRQDELGGGARTGPKKAAFSTYPLARAASWELHLHLGMLECLVVPCPSAGRTSLVADEEVSLEKSQGSVGPVPAATVSVA